MLMELDGKILDIDQQDIVPTVNKKKKKTSIAFAPV
jgi:hypothetical protein